MNNFCVSQLGEDIYGTYCDGELRLVVTQKATGDFVFDCACVIDTLSVRLENMKKENKK